MSNSLNQIRGVRHRACADYHAKRLNEVVGYSDTKVAEILDNLLIWNQRKLDWWLDAFCPYESSVTEFKLLLIKIWPRR